jgi:hypothetical protein
MNLKNYSSTIPASRSVEKIELLLVSAGATHISKSYKDKSVDGFVFQLPVNDKPLSFKLPAKVDAVYNRMLKGVSFHRVRDIDARKRTIREQAERTAWKILLDWVHINVSLIEIDQAKPQEIFLPYLYNFKEDKTFFELVEDNKINMPLLLGEGDGK